MNSYKVSIKDGWSPVVIEADFYEIEDGVLTFERQHPDMVRTEAVFKEWIYFRASSTPPHTPAASPASDPPP